MNTQIRMPENITSVPLDRDGRPKDKSIPIAPEMKSDEIRDQFPGLDPAPSVPPESPAEALHREMKRAQSDDYLNSTAAMPDAAFGELPDDIKSPPQSVPSASGMIDGGAPRAATKAKKPVVKYLGDRGPEPIEEELDDPMEFGGVEYRTVRLSSPRGSKYGSYHENIAKYGAEIAVLWLVCGDMPIEVVNAMSFADRENLGSRGFPFLPRRMRKRMEEAAEAEITKMSTRSSSTTEQSPQE